MRDGAVRLALLINAVVAATDFVTVPPGNFTLGTDGLSFPIIEDEAGGITYDDQPSHVVSLPKQVMISAQRVSQQEYAQSGLPGTADDVSWSDAEAFAKWLT